MKFYIRNKAFTLIELLIVIAIIGLLTSVVAVSMIQAGQRSRDATRKSDLATIAGALALYRADKHEYVKVDRNVYVCLTSQVDLLSNALTSGGYLTSVPCDPLWKNKGWGYDYYYLENVVNGGGANGQKYGIAARLETKNDTKTHLFWTSGNYCDTLSSGLSVKVDIGMNAVTEGYNPGSDSTSKICDRTWVVGR